MSKANANDERILELKSSIEKKRKELKTKSNRFDPRTNCLLQIDNNTYNLHVDSSELLLIKLNSWAISAKDLGYDPDNIIISGYSLSDWISDIKEYLNVEAYKKEKKKLDTLEQQLNQLLSDEKQTELQIDGIASALNMEMK